MKDLIRRVLAVACAAGIMTVMGSVAFASSATIRPMPGTEASQQAAKEDKKENKQEDGGSYGVSASDETRVRTSSVNYMASNNDLSSDDEGQDEENTDDENNGSEPVQVPTIVPIAGVNEAVPQADNTEAAPRKERGYVTAGGMFLWLILALIINAAVSFWIGNRFYKMTKKDNHITAEIRALRRDVEEKFVSNVGGFSEMENEISNSNEDYSMEDGIRIPEHRESKPAPAEPVEHTDDSFEEDAFRRWESRQAEVQAAREARANNHRDLEHTQRISTSRSRITREEPEIRKRQYQPNRADDAIKRREEKEKNQNLNNVKNKAKEFLGDIFPFKED